MKGYRRAYTVTERPAEHLEPMWRATVAAYRGRIMKHLCEHWPVYISDLRRECIGQMDSGMNHRIVCAVLDGIPADVYDGLVIMKQDETAA